MEQAPPPTKRRRRRVVRWVVRVLVGVPLLGALALVLVLKTPLLDAIVRSQVKDMTGCELTASSITLNLDGRLVVNDCELIAPGIDGPAAKLITADRLDVDLDFTDILSGNVQAAGVWLFRPVIRVSQSVQTGELNLTRVKLPENAGGGAAMLPWIDTIEGTLQLAEHSTDGTGGGGAGKAGDARSSYRVLREFSVDGGLTPIEPGKPVYGVRLHEITPGSVFLPQGSAENAGGPLAVVGGGGGGGAGGASVALMSLEGRIDLEAGSASLKLRNLALGELTQESIPTLYHDVWAGLDIRGRVSETEFIYDRRGGARLSVVLDNVAMQTPIPADNPSDPDGTLSLSAVSGTISLSRAGLSARLSALVEDQTVPSTVIFSTQGLDLDAAARCEIISQRINMAEHYDLLPYAPRMVRKYLQRFANPTGQADTRVVIQRAKKDPVTGAPGELTLRGTLLFRDTRAAFEKFPYPFHSLRGHVEFTDSSIDIIDVQGESDSGARLTARGRIEPLHPDAEVDLDIFVLDAPTDEALLAAMPASKRPILDVLFSRPRLDELVEAGLVREHAASDAADNAEASDAAEEEESAKPFRLGGTARVAINVHRDLGPANNWETTINVRFPEVGFVPEPFPFPLVGRDVELLVTDDDAQLLSGTFAGLSGGVVSLEAAASLSDAEGKADLRPKLRVLADDIPVDALLLHAVERMEDDKDAPRDADTADAHELSAAGVLRKLNIEGMVDCDARVTSADERDDKGERKTIYDAAIAFAGMVSRPAKYVHGDDTGSAEHEPGGLIISDLAGDLRVTPEFLRINRITGRLGRAGEHAAPSTSPATPDSSLAAGLVTLACELLTPEAENEVEGDAQPPRSLHASASIDGLDVALPVEDALGIISPTAAAAIAELREKRTPTGVIDIAATAERGRSSNETHTSKDNDLSLSVRVSRPREFEAAVLNGRLHVPKAGGSVTITTGSDASGAAQRRVVFDEFAADVEYNGAAAGTLVADGGFSIAPESFKPIGPADLTLSAWGVELASPIVPAIVGGVLGPEVATAFLRRDLGGRIDLDLSATTPKLTDTLSVPSDAIAQTPPVDVSLTISPSSLTLPGIAVQENAAAGAQPVERFTLSPITGRLTLAGRMTPTLSPTWTIELDRLHAVTPNWSVSAHGGGVFGLDRSLSLDVTLAAAGRGIDRPMLALMPAGVRGFITGLKPEFAPDGGRFELMPTPLRLVLAPSGPEMGANAPRATRLTALSCEGDLILRGVSLDAGVAVRNADADLHIRASSDQTGGSGGDGGSGGGMVVVGAKPKPLAAEISLSMPRAEVAGIALSDARALMVFEDAPGANAGDTILVPYLWANCHQGRLLGSATLHLPSEAERARHAHGTSARGGWYKADMVLAGVQLAPILEEVRTAADITPPSGQTPPDPSRGLVDAWVSIAGRVGDPESRYGRGSIRIADGDVLKLPVIFSLMQLSNFQLPSSDRLDYLQTAFEIEGRIVRFARIAVLSRTLAIVGMGSVTLPDMRVSMIFNSKAAARIPLVSDVVEAVRDELISTVVTGTLAEPEVNTRSFLGIKRALGSIIDPLEPATVIDTAAAEEAARAERDRVSTPGRR